LTRVVAQDDALALQPAHALGAGRGRQADALGQLGHRDAALALQLFEDFAVDAVKFHDFTSQRCLQ
jgi:hypothetical protein